MFSSIQKKPYDTTAVTLAFLAGLLFMFGVKEIQKNIETRNQHKDKPSPSRIPKNASNYDHMKPDNSNGYAGKSMSFKSSSSNIPEGIEGLIGNTPLFKIKSLSEVTGCTILAKAEFLNGAGGSPKDRVALGMIRMAEEQGLLASGRGDTIYEGTAGSTGISIASLARALGYKTHICIPSDQSQEKVDILLCLGAEVERVTPASITSPDHFVNLAKRRSDEHTRANVNSRGFFTDQFENPANFKAHFSSTGPEIWNQTGGQLDAFISGAGTGGTISGIALYLKQENIMGKGLHVVLADPEGSGLHNKVKNGVMFSSTEKEGTRRRHQVDSIVEGIGVNRLTENIMAGMDLIDDSVKVTDLQAMKMAKWLVEKDGIFVGSSSAVNCVAAVVTALKLPKESRIVTILCDSGARHLSKFWKEIAKLKMEKEYNQTDLFDILGINVDKKHCKASILVKTEV